MPTDSESGLPQVVAHPAVPGSGICLMNSKSRPVSVVPLVATSARPPATGSESLWLASQVLPIPEISISSQSWFTFCTACGCSSPFLSSEPVKVSKVPLTSPSRSPPLYCTVISVDVKE